jgi:hypothetical protein
VQPPPSPARTDFTLITEYTPESSGCYSVYSVVRPQLTAQVHTLSWWRGGGGVQLGELCYLLTAQTQSYTNVVHSVKQTVVWYQLTSQVQTTVYHSIGVQLNAFWYQQIAQPQTYTTVVVYC